MEKASQKMGAESECEAILQRAVGANPTSLDLIFWENRRTSFKQFSDNFERITGEMDYSEDRKTGRLF